ncbi:SOS response-associated peptidase [Brachybacterium hainanense]|uniref:Abasic site processing protein n=1 Tax=Brachybacterium hainanense TaxID=1541174 RepID=A0ABV6RC29_9MICO
MCGRFAIDDDVNAAIAAWVESTGRNWREWEPWSTWNLKPTQTMPILLETLDDGEITRRVSTARWSLVPPWAKDLKLKFPTFNARAEQIAEKATWKGPLKSRRALVPAAGYFEWRTGEDGTKVPHWIHAPGGVPVFFAGLYSWWKPKGGESPEWLLTATILTRPSAGPVAGLHDRAPLILPESVQEEWLDPGTEGTQPLVDAMVDAAAPVIEELEFHAVGPLRGDGPELIRPVG